MTKPEDKAREVIDKMLEESGWHVCDYKDASEACAAGGIKT